MQYEIPLSSPSVTRKEIRYVSRALRSGWLTQAGAEVMTMESSIHNWYNQRFHGEIEVTSTSNGTTALHLALLAIGIGPGDEVIIPNFCYVAVANAVLYCGATPVLVDVDQSTWNLSAERVKSALTPRTKAVIAVDNYGREADCEKIKSILPENCSLIQDSAESFPGFQRDLNSNFADLITVSLYANKIVTSGEGGAVIGNPELIERIRKLKNQSQDPQRKFNHDELGWNYRITNLQAAFFNAQWSRKDKFLGDRLEIFNKYFEELLKYDIKYFTNYSNDAAPWLFSVAIQVGSQKMNSVIQKMSDAGIETRPGFNSLNNIKYIEELSQIGSPLDISNGLSESIISLPTFPGMTRSHIETIVASLSKALNFE